MVVRRSSRRHPCVGHRSPASRPASRLGGEFASVGRGQAALRHEFMVLLLGLRGREDDAEFLVLVGHGPNSRIFSRPLTQKPVWPSPVIAMVPPWLL